MENIRIFGTIHTNQLLTSHQLNHSGSPSEVKVKNQNIWTFPFACTKTNIEADPNSVAHRGKVDDTIRQDLCRLSTGEEKEFGQLAYLFDLDVNGAVERHDTFSLMPRDLPRYSSDHRLSLTEVELIMLRIAYEKLVDVV